MKKVFFFIFVATLFQSCTTNYYLFNSAYELPIYSDENRNSKLLVIPTAKPFVVKSKIGKLRPSQYKNVSGWVNTDSAAFIKTITSKQASKYYSYEEYSPQTYSSSTSKSSGGAVHVKGHYRTSKSGKTTYVKPYTRSAPKKY